MDTHQNPTTDDRHDPTYCPCVEVDGELCFVCREHDAGWVA